jgi:alpha-tubulin suppressor-like RCC1 family protein
MYNNLWSFGSNEYGQLGLGDTTNRYIPSPVLINGVNFKVKDIACSGHHSLAIDINDNLWSFGFNGYGQLGLGDTTNRYIPSPALINGINFKVKSIACSGHHSLVIDMFDELWVLVQEIGNIL